MTRKQKLILIISAIVCVLVIAFVAMWQLPSVQWAGIFSKEPVNTIVAQSSQAASVPINTGEEPVWPTVTPRPVSPATATPESINAAVKNVEADTDNTQSLPTIAPTATSFIETTTPTVEVVSVQDSVIYADDESPFSIGQSVQGQDLWMYKFGNGEIQKLIIAGIHGGYEYNTTDLANELIEYIQMNPDIIPENITLYFLPSFNPDGLARSVGYAGRANENNVDLNRNWDFNWKSTWDPTGCWAYLPISGGEAPFSEPEAAALRDFIHSHDIAAIISYHSAALGIFPGGAPDSDISIALAEAVSAVASTYPYPPIQTGCEITGQFVDYASSYGIPALDIELTNHRDSDFEINLEVLKVFLAWVP